MREFQTPKSQHMQSSVTALSAREALPLGSDDSVAEAAAVALVTAAIGVVVSAPLQTSARPRASAPPDGGDQLTEVPATVERSA